MFEFMDYIYVMAAGAVYFVILGILNLKKAEAE